ncbi:N-acetyltransferase [Clostridia bacterium]|nr:N-acetyltransferase [Clostridia bacterium]
MLTYRKATVSDAGELARLRSIFLAEVDNIQSEHERSLLEKANLAYFTTALLDGSFVAWLAIDKDEIVATSGLSFSLVPPSVKNIDGKVAYIMNMYTSPNYRRQGIAAGLFSRIVEEAKLLGYRKLTLNATDSGRPLYEKYGFKTYHGDMVFYVK